MLGSKIKYLKIQVPLTKCTIVQVRSVHCYQQNFLAILLQCKKLLVLLQTTLLTFAEASAGPSSLNILLGNILI